MAGPQISLYQAMLEKAQRDTLQVASGIPEGRRYHQFRSGGATPIWLVGHLASTINSVVLRWMFRAPSQFNREESLIFAPDFAGGTPPTSDPAAYPPWEAVLEKYATVLEQAREALGALPDDALEQSMGDHVPEFFRQRFPTTGATLMQMVSHDAYHRGQMAMLGKE